jgi:hypothetical protein
MPTTSRSLFSITSRRSSGASVAGVSPAAVASAAGAASVAGAGSLSRWQPASNSTPTTPASTLPCNGRLFPIFIGIPCSCLYIIACHG